MLDREYCPVAQPVYLASETSTLKNTNNNQAQYFMVRLICN